MKGVFSLGKKAEKDLSAANEIADASLGIAKPKANFIPKNSRKNKVKWVAIGGVVLIAVALIGSSWLSAPKENNQVQTGKVQQGDIAVTITGSGTLEPLEYYELVPLVQGDIIADYVTEGQQVEKGDLLYQIDTGNMENTIAKNQLSLQKAQISYGEVQDSVANLQVKSDISGTITNLLVEEGDTVQSGAQIAEVTNIDQGLIKVSFPSSIGEEFYLGQQADILLQGSFANLTGTISRISSGTRVTEDYSSLKDIEITVDHPGNISEGQECVITIAGTLSPDTGIYYPGEKKYVTAKTGGEVKSLQVGSGDNVSAGDVIAVLESDTVEKNQKNSSISLQESQLSLNSMYDQLEDYQITAPIAGTVIQKNSKAGDTIDNSSDKTVMAIVADMSKMVFTIHVDELDISEISVGQEVEITADAQPDKTYVGIVDNVSLIGTSSNGVTSYPVEVFITDYDGLLPGMNVDASIVVDSKEDVLLIPTSALYRGNWVAVQGDDPMDKEDSDTKNTESGQKSNKKAIAPNDLPDGFYAVQVETGISNDDYIEIIRGLAEGDVVYLNQVTTNSSNNQMMPGGMMSGGMPSGSGMPSGGAPPSNMGGGSGGGNRG